MLTEDVEVDKHYPPEFKADVVAMALRGEVAKHRIAEAETTLFGWVKQFEIDECPP